MEALKMPAVVALCLALGLATGILVARASKSLGEFTRRLLSGLDRLAQLASEVASSNHAVREATSAFLTSSQELREQVASLAVAAEKLAQVASVQAQALESVRKMEQERLKHPYGKPVTPTPAPLSDPELEYRVQQMVKEQGISREQALLTLNTANASSVWDGFELGS
jgi:uncharacterized phage infection (PIP) family protein YhgE